MPESEGGVDNRRCTPTSRQQGSLTIHCGHHLSLSRSQQHDCAYLCVIPEVRLKAKGLNDRQEGLNNEDGGAWFGQILGHMPSPLGQDCVDGLYAICTAQPTCKP